MSLFPRLGCDNVVLCAQNACLNSFGIKAFTWIRLINSFHMYLLCYADDPVSGERSLPRGSWKTTGLNCWNNGLWILGKENNFCSGASQQLEEEPRNFCPRDTQSPAGQATRRPIKVGSTFKGQQTTWASGASNLTCFVSVLHEMLKGMTLHQCLEGNSTGTWTSPQWKERHPLRSI